MIYGADFRPGAYALPRHNTAQLPPVGEYVAYLATLAANSPARRADAITPARMRRILLMVEHGSSLLEACRLVGENYHMMRHRVTIMPDHLIGTVLARRRNHTAA